MPDNSFTIPELGQVSARKAVRAGSTGTVSSSNDSFQLPEYQATQAPVQTPDDPSVAGAEAPANEDGFWASAAKGAGHTIADWGRSGGQWIDRISALTSTDPEGKAYFQNDLKNLQAHQSEVNRQWDASQPSGMLGKAGRMAGGVAPSLAAAALVGPESLAGNMALGAGLGAADPTSTEDPSAAGSVGAGALGGGVAAGVGKAAGALKDALVGGRLSGQTQEMVDYLQKKGINLDLAQRTASSVANWIKTAAEGDATGAGAEWRDAAKKSINTAAMKMVGTDSDTLDSDAMSKARNSIRSLMSSSIDKTEGIQLDKPDVGSAFFNQLSSITGQASRTLTDIADKKTFDNTMNTIWNSVDMGESTISPEKYMDLREGLFDRISNGGINAKKVYGSVLESLDDAMKASIPPETWGKFQLGRDRTKMLYQLANSVDENGDLNISKLWQTVGKKSNQEQRVFGTGNQQMVDFATALKSVVKSTGPDSGTSRRAAVSNAISAGIGAAGGALTDSDHRTEGAALGGTAGALLGPIAAGKIVYRGAANATGKGLGYLAGSKAGQLVNSLSKKFDSQQ